MTGVASPISKASSRARCLGRLEGSAEVGGSGVDLGVDSRPGEGERRELGRDAEHVADRGPRLEPRRQTDHGDAVGAGQLGELAAGRGHQPLGSERLRRGVAAEGLLGVARIARAEDG